MATEAFANKQETSSKIDEFDLGQIDDGLVTLWQNINGNGEQPDQHWEPSLEESYHALLENNRLVKQYYLSKTSEGVSNYHITNIEKPSGNWHQKIKKAREVFITENWKIAIPFDSPDTSFVENKKPKEAYEANQSQSTVDGYKAFGNLSYALVDNKNIMYYKAIWNGNTRFFQRELRNNALDLKAPMTLFDVRIPPVYVISLQNKQGSLSGDQIELYVYDPDFADNFMMTKEIYEKAVSLKKTLEKPVLERPGKPKKTLEKKQKPVQSSKPVETKASTTQEAKTPEKVPANPMDELTTTTKVTNTKEQKGEEIWISSIEKGTNYGLTKEAYDAFDQRVKNPSTLAKQKNRSYFKQEKLVFNYKTNMLELKK